MSNTTRRYPRTLREAFPHEVDYACAIERTGRAPRITARAYWVLAAIASAMVVAATLAKVVMS